MSSILSSLIFGIGCMAANIPFHVQSMPVANINNRPVIGVLSQQYNGTQSYIAASYVKFAEAAGARVVVIMDNLSDDDLLKLFNSINGVIFPGGESSLSESKYGQTGKKLFRFAQEANAKGDYFPIFGLCLGFQLLSYLVAGENLLKRTYSTHIDLQLQYTSETDKSKLFKNIDPSLKNLLQTKAISYNNHKWSILLDTFNSNTALKTFFKNLATSKGEKGSEFIAAWESVDSPYYGLQWHPEKPRFEWKESLNMDHSFDSVIASQYFGNFFVNEARKSRHRFDAEAEGNEKYLVYNYCPMYSGRFGDSSFEQIYVFDPKT